MDIASLIETYGYAAIFIGTFLEGETILVLAGLMAQRGYLDLSSVILVAFIGTYLGDQMFYYLGRHKGVKALDRRPHWRAKVQKVFDWLHRYKTVLILGFRFLYGIRAITPFVIGASGVHPMLFLVLNGIGALVWAVSVGILGYLFGSSIELLFDHVKNFEAWLFLALSLIALAVWHFRFRR